MSHSWIAIYYSAKVRSKTSLSLVVKCFASLLKLIAMQAAYIKTMDSKPAIKTRQKCSVSK